MTIDYGDDDDDDDDDINNNNDDHDDDDDVIQVYYGQILINMINQIVKDQKQ